MKQSNSDQQALDTALSLFKCGKLYEAKTLLKNYCKVNPQDPTALKTLALIYFSNKKYTKALDYLNDASLYSDEIEIQIHLAVALHKLGQYKKASDIYTKVLETDPNNISVLNNLSVIMITFGNLFTAKDLAEKVINLKPEYIDPYINLGNIYKDMGNIEKAISYYNQALSINPSHEIAFSNMLLALHYNYNDLNYIFEQHKKWNSCFEKINIKHNFNNLSLDRKINIGYLSADFRKHSVSYFIEPLLANHDINKFNIYLYSDVTRPDPVTIKLKNFPVIWRNISENYNNEVFKIITDDKIDILIDLAGHAGNKRLNIFANQAAPIQITYCGYPDTTGISNIQYRITDNISDPSGSDKYYSEKLIRLSKSFLCYRPSKDTPQVEQSPCIKNNYVTFGSFNHLAKLSDNTIELWSTILNSIKNSKLILKAKHFVDENVQEFVLNKFKKNGVDINNISLIKQVASHKEHLNCYNKIDIALDPFPYNGTTTTFESLWMGVPVITLYGDNHASHVGASILNNIGLKSLVASDANSYLQIAKFLCSSEQRLERLRQGLRYALYSSPLCDAQSFTKELEANFIDIIKNELSK